MVIRLASVVDLQKVESVKVGFCDILAPGGDIAVSGPLPAEADEPDIAHLPRIVIDFNRRSFGRLRQFIDVINGL